MRGHGARGGLGEAHVLSVRDIFAFGLVADKSILLANRLVR